MGLYFYHQTHSQLTIISVLAQPLLSLWSCCSCPPLFPSLAYWMPSDLGGSSCSVISFYLFLLFMVFSRQEYWSWLPFHPLMDHFCQHSSWWLIHHGWLCIPWLMASLSCENTFITTRLWSIPVPNCFDYYSFTVSFEISNDILPYYIFFFWLFGCFGGILVVQSFRIGIWV